MSDINVKIADEKELQMWDEIVDSSTMGTIYHRLDWLRAAEEHTKSKLYPLICYEGQEVVGLFPIFYMKKAFVKMAFSPPPNCAIPYMGPIFRYLTDKQSRIEALHNTVVEKVREFLVRDLRSDYILIKTSTHILDVRAFVWESFQANPNYTYMISIEKDTKSIFEGLRKQIRTDIRRAEKEERLEIREGNINDLRTLNRMIMDRYQEQGKVFGISDGYLMNVYKSFPDNIDIINLMYDKEVITGLVLLKYKEVIAHWLGGITPKKNIIGANELLHWWVIENYKEKGYKCYELIGANTKHLCGFKSKFNPRVNIYFNITKRNLKSRIAESIYNTLKGEAK